jgi:ribosomal protein L12E/L44/L45/RPP1/RPP2
MVHINIGEDVLRRVLAALEGKIIIEQPPRLEGRNLTAQIGAKAGAYPKKEKPAQATDEDEDEDDENDDEDES